MLGSDNIRDLPRRAGRHLVVPGLTLHAEDLLTDIAERAREEASPEQTRAPYVAIFDTMTAATDERFTHHGDELF